MVLTDSAPAAYEEWLRRTLLATDKAYVFVNSWNEWGEGAHLEPDDRWAHRFLEATLQARDNGARRNCRASALEDLRPPQHRARGALRMIGEVAQRLGRTDEVTVITWNDVADPPLDGVAQLHRPVRGLHLPPPFHPFGQLLRSWIGSVRAARLANRSGFDVAYVSACQWVQAPEALRRLSIPTLYFAHEGRRRAVEPGYTTRGERRAVGVVRRLGTRLFDLIGSWMDRRAMRGPFRLVANSEHSARQFEAAYSRSAEVVTLVSMGNASGPIPRGCDGTAS